MDRAVRRRRVQCGVVQTGWVNNWITVNPVDGSVTGITCWVQIGSGTVGWGCCRRRSGHLVWPVTTCHKYSKIHKRFKVGTPSHARGCDCLAQASLLCSPNYFSFRLSFSTPPYSPFSCSLKIFLQSVSFLLFFFTFPYSLSLGVCLAAPHKRHVSRADSRPQVKPVAGKMEQSAFLELDVNWLASQIHARCAG